MRAVLLLILSALAACPAAAAEFDLVLDGAPALAYRADCRYADGDGAVERRVFEGLLPDKLRFRVEAVECRVAKRDARGRLRAVLLRRRDHDAERIARAETNALFGWVLVRSAGPWGEALGSRGGPTPPVIEREGPADAVPPLRGDPVPPQRGDPVPPLRGR
jgi:hypothetical protein